MGDGRRMTDARSLPLPHDAERAARVVERLDLSPDGASGALVAGVAGCSRYLARLMERDPAFARSALDDDPAQVWADVFAATEGAGTLERQADVMSALRRQKDRSALFIALRDIGGFWSLDEVIRAVSAFADASIETATGWLLTSHAERGLDPSGFFILGLGKLGGYELNYSSDVDIIPFFDHEGHAPDIYEAQKKGFNRLTRDLVKLLSEQTAEGYVHRVDLRLRPDPGSTPPCMSVDAAERYYESFGKNWERAAFIKARVIAGDRDAGARFLDGMTPFVWRRYLDFAALEDVRDMKRLIHKHKGHGKIAVAGHDLKLGRGGIREIEFFAQTQQLIAGGREPALRLARTVETLDVLLEHGWITADARDELAESYDVLRTLEHRLQMIGDAQTHRMPSDAEELERVAAFCGMEDFASLNKMLRPHLERVSRRFDRLFENDTNDDSQTDMNLADYGFRDENAAQAVLDRWTDGNIGATKSDRARAKLDRLLPVILGSIGEAGDPDRALVEFDRFLGGLPSGVQILSLFEANPNLLEMLTEICAAAPRLATYLGRNSGVIDALLSRDFFEPTPDADTLLAEYQSAAPEVDDFEGNLDACRRWAKERHFRIGAALLRGIDPPEEAGRAYSALADACLRAMVAPATAEVARRHGPPPGEGACVVAMGRLGSHEMTAASDLDLIVIYDDADAMSDGPKPLAGTQYYARWTQRLVNALTAPTAEGAVYEVDMRLRPSGQSGPLATRLTAFERYQAEQAWTWEHMALTRARVVAGPLALRARVEAAIADVLATPRERGGVLRDALEMRHRLVAADEVAASDPWALKLTRGGLVDADFIVQALRLCGDDAVPVGVAEGRALQAALLHFIRLSHDGKFDPSTAPAALKAIMARAVGADGFDAVEERVVAAQAVIRDAFASVFGEL